jgi:hypothetical protein
MQQQLIEMHHFVLPPMVTLVGLYVLFGLKRPGLVRTKDRYVPLGPLYGMPSGDVMMFTMVGVALCVRGWWICGAVVPLVVSFDRIFLGLHDIAQVLVGILFGTIIYWIFSITHSIWTVIINWVLAFVLPLAVFSDPLLDDVRKGDWDNLQGWVLVDMGYLWFDIVYCAPAELLVIENEGLRLAVAVIGTVTWHICYHYQTRNGVSLVKWFKRMGLNNH